MPAILSLPEEADVMEVTSRREVYFGGVYDIGSRRVIPILQLDLTGTGFGSLWTLSGVSQVVALLFLDEDSVRVLMTPGVSPSVVEEVIHKGAA